MFERYVNSERDDIILHEKVFDQLEDNETPIFVNRNRVPEGAEMTVQREEFEDLVDGCVVYAYLTLYYKRDTKNHLFFGVIRGRTDPVYLGMGTRDEILNRAEDYKNYKDK